MDALILNQRICCPIAISDLDLNLLIWIRVSPLSLETDNIFFTFKIFFHCVLVLHLADDDVAFVKRTTNLSLKLLLSSICKYVL